MRSGLQAYEEQHGLESGAIVSRFVAGNEVVGLMLIEPLARHHALLPLCPEMQAQFNIWSGLDGGGVSSCQSPDLFYFRAMKTKPVMIRVQTSELSKRTGRKTCFFHLDAIWASRLFAATVIGLDEASLNVWRSWNKGDIPTLALKVPKTIAFLVANKVWTKVAVPDHLQTMDLVAGWNVRQVLCEDTSNNLLNLRDAFALLQPGEVIRPCSDGRHVDLYNVASRAGKEKLLVLLQSVHEVLFQQGRPPTDETKRQLQVDLVSAALALQGEKNFRKPFQEQQQCFLESSQVRSTQTSPVCVGDWSVAE